MNNFLITYDLREGNSFYSYENLRQAIKTCGYWAKPLQSVFIIRSNSSAIDIARSLQQYLDGNDKLLVIEVGRDWGSINMSTEIVDWFKNNI